MPDESKRRHHYEGGSAPWIVVSGEDGLDRIERGGFEAVCAPSSVLSPCEEPRVEPPFFVSGAFIRSQIRRQGSRAQCPVTGNGKRFGNRLRSVVLIDYELVRDRCTSNWPILRGGLA